jgi:general secretion pathway protein K
MRIFDRSRDRKGAIEGRARSRQTTNNDRRPHSRRQAGSALLTVLWLSAALAAIGFSIANTVRGEAERTSTSVDSLRAYYLATGAIHRAYVELLWSVTSPNRIIPKGSTVITYGFPSGSARVEFIPETAKLDVNAAPVEELTRLMLALGLDPARAQAVAASIDSARRPGAENNIGIPSFPAPHASFQEIEELLQVNGVTPDLFYGTYVPSESSEAGGKRLMPRGGLVDCLSVYGSKGQIDGNTASPAVLFAIGMSPYAINALVQRRQAHAMTQQELYDFLQSIGADPSRFRIEGNSIVTIRATAQLSNAGVQSDLKRTVAAQIKYMPQGYDSAIHILRWYDTAWSN